MHELVTNIRAAILDLIPKLKGHPDQLAARLARSKLPSTTRPPRAWCLAIRASDTRITPSNALIEPSPYVLEPLYQRHRLKNHDTRPLPVRDEIKPHTVRLTSALLARLCPPVRIPYGLTPREIAPLLGVDENSLQNIRHAAILRCEPRPLLHGRRGRPVPMLTQTVDLDPSSLSLKRPPDPLWLHLWQYQAYQIPHDIDQTVARHPVYINHTNRAKSQSRLCFHGFRWLCPTCFRPVRVLYYPLPPISLPDLRRPLQRLAKLFPGGLQIPPLPTSHGGPRPSALPTTDHGPLTTDSPRSFACQNCNRVRHFSSLGPISWNELVSFFTAGLLYGHEVPKPAGFHPTRKKAYKPRPYRPRSNRCEEVLRLLVDDRLTLNEIGARLGIKYATVRVHATRVYKQNNVPNRRALTLLLRPTPETQPPTPNPAKLPRNPSHQRPTKLRRRHPSRESRAVPGPRPSHNV